jgi:hypothetical protein
VGIFWGVGKCLRKLKVTGKPFSDGQKMQKTEKYLKKNFTKTSSLGVGKIQKPSVPGPLIS